MKRRIALAVLAVVAMTGAGSAAQAVPGAPRATSGEYFACAGTRQVDLGVCAQDPLPEHLPVPGIPG